MLSIAASSNVLPTLVIFKGKRALTDIKASNDFIVTVQPKVWVDEDIMLRWVDKCLCQYTNRNHRLLVIDAFHCHLMDSVKKRRRKANAELVVISD